MDKMKDQTMDEINESFPADWNIWRAMWKEWVGAKLKSGEVEHSSYRMPGRNFMADEVIGVYRVAGRTVELSEVTFPDITLPYSQRGTKRFIGITFAEGGGTESGGVVESFAELEQALGL